MANGKVYYNGFVYTVDKDRTVASAVVTEGDRIAFVGNDEEAKAFAGDEAELFDLGGRMMIPGLIDGHCHPIMAAHLLSGIVLDIDWTTEENLKAIRAFVEEHPEKENYVGTGYAEWNFDEHGPAKELLDEICSDKPMFLFGSGGHEGWANSKTFELAGITKDTPDPVPGLHYFARDAEGNPSGHVAEGQAMEMIFKKIQFFDKNALKDMILTISEDYASFGVTTTADMGVTELIGFENYKAGLDIIRHEGYLQRFNGPGVLLDTEGAEEKNLEYCRKLREEFDDDRIRISLFKIINDGTMESRTAAISEPYPEDGSIVKPLLDEEGMVPVMLKAAEAGFHINAHAIGDDAVKAVIAGAKAVREAGHMDTRITCSHCQYIQPDDVEAFALHDITANSTGVWFYGSPMMDKVIGHINDETFRMRSLKDAGARVAFGSDFPVDEYGHEPLKSMEMAVTRKMYAQPDSPMLKPYDEVLTVDDAIAGYTIHNAIQLGMEDRLGTIEPGKYADLVVLEKNLFEIPPEEIHRVKVCETIVGGETVYKKGASKLFYNSCIYTMDEDRSWADAVAIDGNQIVYVGDREGAEAFCDAETQRVDLDGKMMLPGFIDGHCHPVMAAHFLCGVYLEIEMTPDDCLDAIRKYVEENPDLDTYFGLGYAEWIFDETGPKKEMLDAICADKPMMIMGSSAHESWVNSKTLELAGITKDTPDPIPGFHYFHRDAEGNPTGHLVEAGPQMMIFDKVRFFTEETVGEVIAANSCEYAMMGVTSTCDMGMQKYGLDLYFNLIPQMIEEGTYMQRFFGCGEMLADKKDMLEILDAVIENSSKYNSDKFNIHFLKIINDGTLETRSAALSEPYNEEGVMVEPLLTKEEIRWLGLQAAKNGLDINVHAIGDEAISGTLAMAQAVREAGYDDVRITNSHCDYVKDDELPLFGKYNVIANTTCVWHYGNPDMEVVIGDRQNRTFRMKSIINGGARMGQGSDFPVDEFGREPLKGIEMGCTRQLFDHPELPVLKPYEEKLSIDDGIASYTINNAYQMHMEDKLGSIETGKLADLVILEKNLFEVPLSEIHKVKICETIMDGDTVYRA